MDKIILVTVSYPFGSGEQFLESEIEFLSKKGMDITIYPSLRKGVARKLPNGVNVAHYSLKNPWYKSFINAVYILNKYLVVFINDLILTLKKERIDFFKLSRLGYIAVYWARSFRFILWYKALRDSKSYLYYTYWMNSESYALSVIKRKNLGLATISRVHGGDLYKDRTDGFLPFREVIVKSLSGIYPISNHGKKYLIEQYGKEFSEKIHVSRLGVSPSSRIKASSNTIVVASCSSDDPIKRVMLILQSVGELSTYLNEKVTWVHIGIEKNIFEKVYGAIVSKYPNLICNSIGVIPNSEVVNVYKKYRPSLFINLSESEGVPVSIMEALSCGLPVIATNVGGVSEILNDSVGRLVDKDFSLKVVVNAMSEIIKDREGLSIEALQKWSNICNENKNYTEFFLELQVFLKGRNI